MPETIFQLTAWQPAIPVTVGKGVSIDINEERLLGFPAFKNWLQALAKNLEVQENPGHTFKDDPWRLEGVLIHHVTIFENSKIGFMTIEALLKKDGTGPDRKSTELNRVIFLRGGSVAVLMILRPKDSIKERYVILTEQPRIGACSTSFLEIPAGMLDDKSGDVIGKAMQEIREETGLHVRGEELIDLTEMALESAGREKNEHLQPALYMSPANLDEYIPLLLWEKTLDRKEIQDLKGKLTGVRAEDELITLHVRDYEVLWREGARDAKTLAAWALYEGLNRAGKIEERLHEIRTQGKRKRVAT
jgi:8-oxo-dGTP pyrophosphatase MutT (NUDIX family)